MNDSAQAIITIIVVLVILALCLSPVVGLWVYIFYNNSKRKKTRARILATRPDLIGANPWFPVRYASQERFDSLFKILPWESAGIMVVAPGSVLFLGETSAGAPRTFQLAPANSRLGWLGKCPWPNGAVSWFQFETAEGKRYFSSETGVMIFGSHASTKAIFDQINGYFGAPPAQNL